MSWRDLFTRSWIPLYVLIISKCKVIKLLPGDPQGIDIGLVVDSSNSVDWNRMLTYIQYLVEYFYDEVNSNVGFGMITYGDGAKVVLPLNSKDTRKDVLSFIGQIQKQGGTNAGFTQAMQLLSSFFSPQQGGRVGLRQVNSSAFHMQLSQYHWNFHSVLYGIFLSDFLRVNFIIFYFRMRAPRY